MMKVDISKSFKPLYTSLKRYFLITGGRASLKSTTVHDFVARLTYEEGHGILFTRYTMTSAVKSIIPEFNLTIKKLGIEADFHVTKNVIHNIRTNSFIYFSGIKTSTGDQTANLKSIPGITTWIIEEGEDFLDEKAFDTIDDSIRTTTHQNRIIWIQNPSTKEHFIFKRWIERTNKHIRCQGYDVTVSDHEDVEAIHTTYHLAEKKGYLSQGWLSKANRAMHEADVAEDKYSTHYYHNYIGGWLERAEGVIFTNWSKGEFDQRLDFIFGMDFGHNPDPTCLVKVAVDKKQMKIFIEECFYLNSLSVNQMTSHVRQSVKGNQLIVADNRDGVIIESIAEAGFNIQKCRKERLEKRIKQMQDFEIVVCGDSSNIEIELNNYVWNDKKAGVPIDNYNHALDSMAYAFEQLNRGAIWVS